jgi:phosphatidylglycerophosphatase C
VTPAERPAVAAFDFDGTLTQGGSVLPFLVALRGYRAVALAVARELPALVRGAIESGPSADDAKEGLFTRLLAGVPVSDARTVGAAFAARHLRRRLRHDARQRLEWHRARGDLVIVVSASPDVYVHHAAQLLGADGAVATRLEVGGDLLTGRYEGKNCRGQEKYAGVVAWIRSNGFAVQPELWAYGNSRGDRRLLDAADHGVNAGRLGGLGRLRRFPTLAEVMRESGTPRTASSGSGSTAPDAWNPTGKGGRTRG